MNNAVGYLCGVINNKPSAVRFDNATIADLSACLGIETGFIKNNADLDAAPNLSLVLETFVVGPADYLALALLGLVFMQVFGYRQLRVTQGCHYRNALLSRSCSLSLLFHQLAKFSRIDFQAAFFSHKLGQIEWKPVCIIKLESIFAADGPFGFFFGPVGVSVEDFNSSIERSAETPLF